MDYEANVSAAQRAAYCSQYAKLAPLYRDIWNGRDDTLAMEAAIRDIHAALPLHPMGGYAGRLYAELDAVRERLAAVQKQIKADLLARLTARKGAPLSARQRQDAINALFLGQSPDTL